jgi:hypothetical protein
MKAVIGQGPWEIDTSQMTMFQNWACGIIFERYEHEQLVRIGCRGAFREVIV